MELYKKLLAASLVLIALTPITACAGFPSLLSAFIFLVGLACGIMGLMKGKEDILNYLNESKRLEEFREKEDKINMLVRNIKCSREKALDLLERYNWDEVKVFMELQNSPGNFEFTAEISSTNKCSRCGIISPENASFCINCGSQLGKNATYGGISVTTQKRCFKCGALCSENSQYCSSCEDELRNSGNSLKTGEKKCPVCSYLCSSSLEYCPSCEASLTSVVKSTRPLLPQPPVKISIEKRCPKCGTMCFDNIQYCNECGLKL